MAAPYYRVGEKKKMGQHKSKDEFIYKKGDFSVNVKDEGERDKRKLTYSG